MFDLVDVRVVNDCEFSQTTSPFGGLARKQMALTSMAPENLAGCGDLKPLDHGLFSLDTLRTTHVKWAFALCKGAGSMRASWDLARNSSQKTSNPFFGPVVRFIPLWRDAFHPPPNRAAKGPGTRENSVSQSARVGENMLKFP